MKVRGNTVVIGIDHGYGNIKTANTVTPTGLVTYNKEPTVAESILHYNGKFHRVGEGHKAFIADKTSDDEFYLLTLAAIAKEMNLPVKLIGVGEQMDDLKDFDAADFVKALFA